eukprot:TRINITY_DN890_c0_g1_i2.p1 TRINITY_DN890_c0_g1~~TRINITY_DN890_c0_g1_i2.p1  ORF type:complete len:228 (+),score=-33.04 TRINITY_DN890_c0_g1_i2:82-765(+)
MLNSVGSRFEEALITRYGKKNNKEVAEKYGYTQQAIGKLKTKEVINETICIISEKENINLNWLQTGKGKMFIEDGEDLPFLNNNIPSKDVVSINFYPEVYAAAGYGALNGDVTPKKMHLSKIFLDEIINIRKYDRLDIIRVYGDSMEPYVSNGEYVIIEKNNEAKNGETVIANINGEVYIKRFKSDPFKTWIKLQSDNSSYDDIHIEGENLNLIKIIGIVRAKIKPF